MADKVSILDIDGLSDVIIKFLDMIEHAVGWTFAPKGSKKDFSEGLSIYKKAIEDDKTLNGIEKAAKISNSRKELKQYLNQGKIISYATKDIREDAAMDVDDDWLSFFFEYAKNISDDKVQQVWGKILAEQYNGSRSIKRKLIYVLSLLDLNSALAFGKLCGISFDFISDFTLADGEGKIKLQTIPLIINREESLKYVMDKDKLYMNDYELIFEEYNNYIPNKEQLIDLKEIGLIEISDKPLSNFEYLFNFEEGCKNRVFLRDTEFVINIPKWRKFSCVGEKILLKLGTVKYTAVGQCLYHIVKNEEYFGLKDILKVYLDMQGFKCLDIE